MSRRCSTALPSVMTCGTTCCARAGPGNRVLDLAAGTGTSALSFTATGADCVACDFSLGMLRAGQSRLAQRGAGRADGARRIGLVAGDALRLPFRDEAFDAVTIS